MKRILLGAAAGAVAMYFFDPDRGHSRRAKLAQNTKARKRSFDHVAERVERDAANRARGEEARAHGAGIFHPSDDRALEMHLHQVLEELDVATTELSVESVDGLVRVRGQVASEADIARVVRAVNGVPGVHGVESLMHLPGEPAPNKKPARSAGVP